MKQSTIFTLLGIGWIILLNSIILKLSSQNNSLSNNLITGAAVKNGVVIASQTIGKIIVPLIIFNILVIALLLVGHKIIHIKNNKIKFEF